MVVQTARARVLRDLCTSCPSSQSEFSALRVVRFGGGGRRAVTGRRSATYDPAGAGSSGERPGLVQPRPATGPAGEHADPAAGWISAEGGGLGLVVLGEGGRKLLCGNRYAALCTICGAWSGIRRRLSGLCLVCVER